MPIDAMELDKAANAHLLCPATDTVYAALTTWRSTPNSYEWWWLVIGHGDRRYTALRFETLRDLLAAPGAGVTMEMPLADLPPRRDNPADWERPFPGTVTPVVVEQNSMGTARAQQIVNDSPGRLLVVLDGDQFRGILSASERTFAFADTLLVDMLDEYEQQKPVDLAPDDTDIPARTDPTGDTGSTSGDSPDA
jgi:hypothetical protein